MMGPRGGSGRFSVGCFCLLRSIFCMEFFIAVHKYLASVLLSWVIILSLSFSGWLRIILSLSRFSSVCF